MMNQVERTQRGKEAFSLPANIVPKEGSCGNCCAGCEGCTELQNICKLKYDRAMDNLSGSIQRLRAEVNNANEAG